MNTYAVKYAKDPSARLEKDMPGQYVAIDVLTGDAHTGRYPEEALAVAKQKAPTGLFHLIRIGSVGAYRVSHLLCGDAVAR